MKKQFSIGYTDKYGDFTKVWDEKGYTLKFTTIEEAEEYIKNSFKIENTKNKAVKIMKGWEIVKEIEGEI